MRILVIPNSVNQNNFTYVNEACERLRSVGAELMLESRYEKYLCGGKFMFSEDIGDLLESCDAVIAVGGDGTIIHAAKLASEKCNKPVLGINTGRLGFTAGLESTELDLIGKLVSGDYTTESRMMLEVTVKENGAEIYRRLAINDAVIARGALPHIIDLRAYHNERLAMEFRADGLIISTPTGSTAYSLSAGGPAIEPQVRCIMATPVCPHSLHTRTIIFSSESEIRIETGRHDDNYLDPQRRGDSISGYLTVDGEEPFVLNNRREVIIRRSDICAQFIEIKKQSFAEVIQRKFASK